MRIAFLSRRVDGVCVNLPEFRRYERTNKVYLGAPVFEEG